MNEHLPKLRDYQEKGMRLMREAFTDGKRKIILFAATGSGKGVWFLHMINNALRNKKRVILVMRRKQLVYQARDRFVSCGIKPSIVMANEKGFEPENPFQICSIDTVARRDMAFFSTFNFVVVDEMHDTTSRTYREFFSIFGQQTIFIGLSATPFPNGKKTHDFWDCCVKPVRVSDLVERGFLSDCLLYVPRKIDLSDVKINQRSQDYDSKELAAKMSKLEIIGDVLEDYKKIGQLKPAICFCVNVEHSKTLCLLFNRGGIESSHVDESTPQKERDLVIRDFKRGKIKVIFNVNIFSTGVDIPEIQVAIMARPTKSEILWIQMVGRAFRPCRICGECGTQYDNSQACPLCHENNPSFIKTHAIVIDSGDNCARLGHPFDDRMPAMKKDDVKKRESSKSLMKTCKKCFFVYDANKKVCPSCHGVNESPSRVYTTLRGEIVPYDQFQEIKACFANLRNSEIFGHWNPNAKYFKLYEKFGEKCMAYKDEFGIPSWIPKVMKKKEMEKVGAKVYE